MTIPFGPPAATQNITQASALPSLTPPIVPHSSQPSTINWRSTSVNGPVAVSISGLLTSQAMKTPQGVLITNQDNPLPIVVKFPTGETIALGAGENAILPIFTPLNTGEIVLDCLWAPLANDITDAETTVTLLDYSPAPLVYKARDPYNVPTTQGPAQICGKEWSFNTSNAVTGTVNTAEAPNALNMYNVFGAIIIETVSFILEFTTAATKDDYLGILFGQAPGDTLDPTTEPVNIYSPGFAVEIASAATVVSGTVQTKIIVPGATMSNRKQGGVNYNGFPLGIMVQNYSGGVTGAYSFNQLMLGGRVSG